MTNFKRKVMAVGMAVVGAIMVLLMILVMRGRLREIGILRAIGARLVSHRVKRPQIRRHFRIQPRHLIEPPDFVQSPASPIRQTLQTRARRAIDSDD